MHIENWVTAVFVGYARMFRERRYVMLVLPCAQIFFEREWIGCMIGNKSLVSLWVMTVWTDRDNLLSMRAWL